MAKTRLMIVEDESIVALDIQNRLVSMGFEVPCVVSSGREAVEKAAELRPDLILMDIMLDGEFDGIVAAGRIREKFNIPVVYLTAYADEDTLQRAKVTEPFGYIIKPFEDRELSIAIEMALYKYKIERRLVESERWLFTTLKSIGDGVITTDSRGRIKFLNPVAEKLLRLSGGTVLGRPLEDIFPLQSESGEAQLGSMTREVLQSGMTITPDSNLYLRVQEAEEKLPVNITFSAIRNSEQAITGTVLVFRDISERLMAEAELRKTVNQLQSTLEETVNALAFTSEKRDPYTAGHQQRVAELACAMAAGLGITGERVEGIRWAGVLHDLGKIYVPAEILSKPAKLTDMEMGIVKTHSQVGFDILKSIPFPWPVARIVLQHHERMDGSGYPLGVTGNDLLDEAKIVAVADVVEAMSSHRPYRAALGIEKALDEIALNRGRLYDKDAVDVCLDLFHNKDFKFSVFM